MSDEKRWNAYQYDKQRECFKCGIAMMFMVEELCSSCAIEDGTLTANVQDAKKWECQVTLRPALSFDAQKPSPSNPKGFANTYNIQLRDLFAMHILSGWVGKYNATEETIRTAYRIADMALKVRNEAT